MAGVKISSYGVGDTDLTALMSSADKQRRGFCGCSLTNYDNDSLPAIAEGSIVEVNGALFEFPADESIGGSPSDGTVYIKVIPSGDSCTAEFDNDAPTWDDEKQGWYEAATNNRYLPFFMTKAAAVYSKKYPFPKHKLSKEFGFMDDGTMSYCKTINITLAGVLTNSAAHGITNAYSGHNILSAIAVGRMAGAEAVNYDYVSDPNNAIYRIFWNDTNITILRKGSTGTVTYCVFIIYK